MSLFVQYVTMSYVQYVTMSLSVQYVTMSYVLYDTMSVFRGSA